MTVDPSRARAVSTTSNTVPLEDDYITPVVAALHNLDLQTWQDYKENETQVSLLQQLRFKLKDLDVAANPRDAFRRAHGFQVIVQKIRGLAQAWSQSPLAAEVKDMIQVLAQYLFVLEPALVHHSGNNRYFRTRVEDGGWKAVQASLLALLNTLVEQKVDVSILEQFYGILFATSVGDEALSSIYSNVAKACPSPKRSWDLKSAAEIEAQIQKYLEDVTDIAVPDVLPIMVRTWVDYIERTGKQIRTLNLALPISFKVLLSVSKQNVVEAHTAGLLSAIIPLLFDGQHTLVEKSSFRELALVLFQQGVTNLNDAHFFFAKAATSAAAASFLLEAVRVSRQPANIQFDLSRYGSASIELPTLRKVFPPSNSDGYTLTMWARFDTFDPDAHTTLFGACDKTQTCFVLAYLEKDTHHLILQTAIKGSRPSVRFKSVRFDPGQWYHICIVHKKPRTTTSSKASLFVDGLFVEQSKANFPMTPPSDRSGPPRVQAFFGTPQDLAPTVEGTCQTLWSLASATLFEIPLNEDIIAVMFHLGPEYHGNLQDCLGSFQTYAASAALNFRNESLNAGNENSSTLSVAIRQKASNVLPEEAILINVSPAAVLDNDDRNNIDESQLIKSLSKTAAKNLFSYTRAGANAVVINGAVPAINDALVQSNGVAMLMGEPVITVPQSLDDVSWRLGGCASIGLSLVQKAKTTEDVATAVDILLETVKDSWRNSEVMERNSGYTILSSLIKERLLMPANAADSAKSNLAIPTPSLDRSGLALRLMSSILSFLGYNDSDPSRSMINNPLAYKVLLIDNSVWRLHHFETQELYFKQFVIFAKESVHAKFNLRRLSRMRALRRLIEALKSENVSRNTMSSYTEALSALLPTAMSAEMLRSMALFITYSVHKRNSTGRLRKPARSRASSGAGSITPPNNESASLSQFEIGVEVLRLYSDMLCKKGETVMIKKFARTVTNKWLLYLLSEASPEVIVLSMRILARLLVVHGEAYVKKFKDKTGGFAIMAHRLKRWWHLPALWPACFAILFDVDVAELDLDRSFDLFSFVDLFNSKKEYGVVYPEMLEVITGMLQSGLKTIVSSKQHQSGLQVQHPQAGTHTPERLSMSTMAPPDPFLTLVTASNVETFNTIVRFLSDLQSRSARFREFAATSTYVQDLLFVLFPVVVGADTVEASVELNARDSMLSFDGTDVVVQPLSARPPVIRAVDKEADERPHRGKTLRRGSSFVLVSGDLSRSADTSNSTADANRVGTKTTQDAENNVKHTIVQSVLELVVSLFVDQILTRKDFGGLGLFIKTPPGFIEHQTFFESWVLRNTISQLSNSIAMDLPSLREPKVLTNLARFISHLGDAIFEGWFIGGLDSVVDLASTVLQYLQRPDVAQLKSVKLCAQPISVIRAVVFRVELLSLSQLNVNETLAFLKKLAYWQNVLLAPEEVQSTYLSLLCYLLYGSLISEEASVRNAAADLWRTILVQKPTETATILSQASTTDQKLLASSFEKLVELDNDTFLSWIDEHREELDSLFFGTLSKAWDAFVGEENEKTEESAKARVTRRRERLKAWAKAENDTEDLLRRHDVTFDHWTANIHSSETLKHQRLVQDQSDDLVFTNASFARMRRELARATNLFSDEKPRKWRVDQTEGRNRMRMRLVEDFNFLNDNQQPKRKGSDVPALRLDTKGLKPSTVDQIGATPGGFTTSVTDSPHPGDATNGSEPFPNIERSETLDNIGAEESFELVEDPNAGQEDFEDRNRKVMRSLRRGDQVKHVANISRVAGLEAVEGLLILGKDYVYLIDNFFQRADGEIVHVWQAPAEERDPYVGMIAGRDVSTQKPIPKGEEHETRSWKWSDVISISKRRFLFRDVAIEVFFGDGRSYLLTVLNTKVRNDLYALVNAKAPQYGNPDSPQSEVAWRYETLKSAEDEPQTLGARFASVFAQSSHLAATKKWQKGEMSNFHYLMLINTLAGRTYNDLTQYPVFPWVIADYTSNELDLSNPASYRDLSKPMGCQHPDRESEFRERYKQFAEMGDSSAPPFHYGTHYSSAMIVTSYMIRLQPFVKSYLLLQGGTFDHPDRMFFSVDGAWQSASRTNMTDVRELTPEFFYLPEFLTNPNGYDFGMRQNSTKSIGDVILPPWARGDPKVFISKQREALESPYVSKHLHKWIDLVFGCKQKGEAAVEAANVFHHLSYQGARDLDAIQDPVERLATIGIIHNFGQTPYQVFQRPHPQREHSKHKYKRLDSAAESLTRIPGTLLDSEERVASLTYAAKADKLLCSGAFRLNIPPVYDKYMEWGFSDNSIRFYSAETRKQIGLFEHLHVGQLSGTLFGDSKTLITAGTDCTVAVWTLVNQSSKSIDVQPKATLFGHRSTVTNLALSRSFNALLSCSSSGEMILWDLNRCEFVRRIQTLSSSSIECVSINDVTGNIVICQGSTISIFTLNGDPIVHQDTSEHNRTRAATSPNSGMARVADDNIVSVACYEGAGNEWLERDILLTGHRRGVVKVWHLTIEDGVFVLEMIRQLNHIDSAREDGGNVSSAITCILPLAQVVYTGDEDGRVVEWNCVQRH